MVITMEKTAIQKFEMLTDAACREKKIAGAACMAADTEKIIYEHAFGMADTATGAPMTVDSVFAIASMTKPIVATACMQLVEQGLLDLDTDVGEYVSDFKNPLVLEGFDENDTPILRPAKRAVTLRTLMSQTSGVSHEGWDARRLKWCRKFGIGPFGTEARRVPLCFDPGEKWAYGLGIDWVMECMMAVTGKTLEQMLQEQLFVPLGMSSTSFHLSPEMARRVVGLHIKNGDDPVISNTALDRMMAGYGKWHDYGEGEGHGGLYSTARDYLRFLQMIISGGTFEGQQYLKPETIKEMGSNQIGDLYMHWEPATRVGAYGIDLDDFLGDGQKSKWGLGWLVNEKETALGRGAGGMCWFGGYDTYMWADPVGKLCGVAMMQHKTAATVDSMSVYYNFERMLHDKL